MAERTPGDIPVQKSPKVSLNWQYILAQGFANLRGSRRNHHRKRIGTFVNRHVKATNGDKVTDCLATTRRLSFSVPHK
jgi:hypothetical protein